MGPEISCPQNYQCTCFFIWRLDLMILMQTNSLLGPLEGVGPEISTFLGPMALAFLFAISGPKKVSISVRTPYNGPSNEYCLHQNHYALHIRYIHSYN
jgi:hypothetical protein